MTPHIEAKKGDIAKTVLMPGDPLRAEFIANKYLQNVKQVNSIRNMLMFTGGYKGKEISICGSGMGMPSIGIYSYELFKFYDVDNIIRVGSSGAYSKELKLYDIVIATEAYTDSTSFSELVTGTASNLSYPSHHINEALVASAARENIDIHQARVHSSDVFYASRALEDTISITKAKCVEMEAAALFVNAEATGKHAGCILTISDHLLTGEETTPQERQSAFDEMIKVALEAGILL